jgi:hypothetical protein
VSSADFAFDQPLKGVPRSPGKTSANFARRSCSVRWTLSPSDRRLWRSSRAGWLSGTRCGIPFLVRVAGIVQVAKSSESSAHVIPATSSRRWPVRSPIIMKSLSIAVHRVAPLAQVENGEFPVYRFRFRLVFDSRG